ncbi:PIN domain-containing protein [Fusibacter bizertensis]|uniref:PIN domain-containing protein n=1 Tax=Fusibacter bizertensis TaxID=1488331 RepID=A0ABT6NGL6_9FIRM|nr:PIN domain-containing protein [Fusibacter bizertensis]MDH8679498.1 PIN domain-containing protein [Fusibacter bizertensis]
MKYIMLDTNIIINLFVRRDISHKPNSYNQLIKLLDYDKAKVILPSIVITETNRHLTREIEKIGASIKELKVSVSKLNWINNVEAIDRFNEKLKPMELSINNLYEEFNFQKDDFIHSSNEMIKFLFQHENVVIIEEDEMLLFKASQRELHKKRPFHYGGKKEDKNSLPDAVIIETLINLKNFIDLNSEDDVYFISNNPKDFSSVEDNGLLHEDILNDLEKNSMIEHVHYSTKFTLTLKDNFKPEFTVIGMYEEIESEAQYEEEIERIQYDYWMEENNREYGGLSSLSVDYEEKISVSDEFEDFTNHIQENLDELSKQFEKYYELLYSFYEELFKYTDEEFQRILNEYHTKEPLYLFTDTDDLDDLRCDIYNKLQEICYQEDYFDVYDFYSLDERFVLGNQIAKFKIDEVEYAINCEGYINPESGETDEVYIQFYKDKTLVSKGEIEIYYGYMNFDEDGNADDGAEESMNFRLEKLYLSLENLFNPILNDIKEKCELLARYANQFGIKVN